MYYRIDDRLQYLPPGPLDSPSHALILPTQYMSEPIGYCTVELQGLIMFVDGPQQLILTVSRVQHESLLLGQTLQARL
jgi:hypothetical protein